MRTIAWLSLAVLAGGAGPPAAAQTVLVIDRNDDLGIIWSAGEGSSAPAKVYERRSGRIDSLGVGPTGLVAFTDTGDDAAKGKIYGIERGRERLLYEYPRGWVRDIVIDQSGDLYFSTSSGGAADGAIFRLPAGWAPADRPELFYTVRLEQFEGYWSGNFGFAPAAGREEPDLYLSSGSSSPGKLFRVRRSRGAFAAPELVVRLEDHVILGFDVDAEGRIYFADNRQSVWKLASLDRPVPQRHVKLTHFGRAADVTLAP